MASSGESSAPIGRRVQQRRSASPPDQPTPLNIRDEPPARSTRSRVSAPPISEVRQPTLEQRNPLNCPFTRCRASTVHQHLPQLQYYHPRPSRAARYRGYENPVRNASTPRSLGTAPQSARQDQGGSMKESDVAGNEQAARQDQETKEPEVVTGDVENVTHKQTSTDMSRQSIPQDDPSPEETDKLGQGSLPLEGVADGDTMPLIPLQAPMTPPPSSPTAAEEKASAKDSEQQQQQPPSPTRSSPQVQQSTNNIYPDPFLSPSAAFNPDIYSTFTYAQLIRPVIDPSLPPAPGMEQVTLLFREMQQDRDNGDCNDHEGTGYVPRFFEGVSEDEDEWGAGAFDGEI